MNSMMAKSVNVMQDMLGSMGHVDNVQLAQVQ